MGYYYRYFDWFNPDVNQIFKKSNRGKNMITVCMKCKEIIDGYGKKGISEESTGCCEDCHRIHYPESYIYHLKRMEALKCQSVNR